MAAPRRWSPRARPAFWCRSVTAPALVARIGTLLDSDAMCRAMGAAGRRVVVERFSLDAAASPFLQTYDELLAKKAGDLCVASGRV